MATKPELLTQAPKGADQQDRETVFDIFRRWGYLQASLDPLGQYLPPEPFPTPAPEGELAAEARTYYSGTIAVEFMHILSAEKRQWLEEKIERKPAKDAWLPRRPLHNRIGGPVLPPDAQLSQTGKRGDDLLQINLLPPLSRNDAVEASGEAETCDILKRRWGE